MNIRTFSPTGPVKVHNTCNALASVFPPPLLLAEPPALNQVGNGSLNGASGQLQLRGDGTNRRVAFAFLVASVTQIHGHRPVRQLRGSRGMQNSPYGHLQSNADRHFRYCMCIIKIVGLADQVAYPQVSFAHDGTTCERDPVVLSHFTHAPCQEVQLGKGGIVGNKAQFLALRVEALYDFIRLSVPDPGPGPSRPISHSGLRGDSGKRRHSRPRRRSDRIMVTAITFSFSHI